MATEKYPNQNVEMPMSKAALDKARARLDPGFAARISPPEGGTSEPAKGGIFSPDKDDGKGSRRQIRPGEWIDDRKIVIGGPSSPSKDSPPDLDSGRATPPASYAPDKTYQVRLGKPALFAGRMLSPAKEYTMQGSACTEISGSIIDAVELGDVPQSPDSPPSGEGEQPTPTKAKK